MWPIDDEPRGMSFADGFAFVEEDGEAGYPPVVVQEPVELPERRVVYVSIQGSRIRVGHGRLVVESAEARVVLDVPTGRVRRIVCFGFVGVSAGARSWALREGVEIVFASWRGSYLGSLLPGTAGARPERIRAQVAVAETEKALVISRAIVAAKISKQITVLQRFGRRSHPSVVRSAVPRMRSVELLLPACGSLPEVMGVEGAAAAVYFPAYGALFPEPLQFTHRSRRPPLDVANSALSFLYTVMLGECVTAVWAAGLEPSLGVLHADDERRPSLALDVLEEFRPLVVDQVVLEAARQGRFTIDSAVTEEERDGLFLTRQGRAALLDGYERRMLTRVGGALPGFAGTIRRHLYRQAQRLQAAICDPDAVWTGLSWR